MAMAGGLPFVAAPPPPVPLPTTTSSSTSVVPPAAPHMIQNHVPPPPPPSSSMAARPHHPMMMRPPQQPPSVAPPAAAQMNNNIQGHHVPSSSSMAMAARPPPPVVHAAPPPAAALMNNNIQRHHLPSSSSMAMVARPPPPPVVHAAPSAAAQMNNNIQPHHTPSSSSSSMAMAARPPPPVVNVARPPPVIAATPMATNYALPSSVVGSSTSTTSIPSSMVVAPIDMRPSTQQQAPPPRVTSSRSAGGGGGGRAAGILWSSAQVAAVAPPPNPLRPPSSSMTIMPTLPTPNMAPPFPPPTPPLILPPTTTTTTTTYRASSSPAAPPTFRVPVAAPPPPSDVHLPPLTTTISSSSSSSSTIFAQQASSHVNNPSQQHSELPRPPTTSPLLDFQTRDVHGQAAQPPSSATTNFVVRDMGNCSPRYMRCTLSQVPCSRDLLASSGMLLALVVQPLALPHPAEEPAIPSVDFGDSGPLRCGKCKAYINPFMRFMDRGHRFNCNFCGHTNDTPHDYLCSLGPDGRSQDADVRPELCRGTVEFVATRDYMVRPPMAPIFFFLIDVSKNAVDSGAAGAACAAVRRALADVSRHYSSSSSSSDNNNVVKVGIATYDTTLHFYSFNKASKQPSMLVVPDVDDAYAPLRPGLTVPITEYREELEELLGSTIPSMFQGTMIAGSAMGAAIKGASLVIRSNGGKLFVFQSGLPSIGFSTLTAREKPAKEGHRSKSSEMEQIKLRQPNGESLKTLAIELAEHQICCDLFLMTTQGYVDIASLSVLPSTTGGQVYYYYPFSAACDSAKLYNDLRWNLTRPQGLEAVMIVRCSQGLEVQAYSGNFHRGTPTDLDFASIDCDKTILVSLRYSGGVTRLQEGSECYFQCALLYTTTDGRRSIRVSTLSLPCTTRIADIFRGADFDAQFTYFAKQAASEASTRPLSELREKLTNSCVDILHAYRESCDATTIPSRQLLLPQALRLLPLYVLALTKSLGLRSSSDVRADDRCYWLSRMASISSSLAISAVYPRMYAIHDLKTKEIGNGSMMMPETLHLSSENLSPQGIYLLETGEDAFIYAGEEAPADLISELFGARSANDNVNGDEFVLREWDNDASRKLNALVNEILKKERCSDLRVRWCGRRRSGGGRRDDASSSSESCFFFSFMVEDDHDQSLGLSYARYLAHLHNQIQHRTRALTNQRNEAFIAAFVDS